MIHIKHKVSLSSRGSASGFSLVELMVGVTVGLITVLVISNSYIGFEKQKRTTTSGSDSQQNGLIALHAIQTDARMAGFGLTLPSQLVCTEIIKYELGNISKEAILPVLITDGGGVQSDKIKFTYSDAGTGSTPSVLMTSMPSSDSSITMTRVNMAGYTVNRDKFLLASPVTSPGTAIAQPCTRLAYVDTTVADPLMLANLNPPFGTNIAPSIAAGNPADGYGAYTSFAINMGQFLQTEYSVDANNDFVATDKSIAAQAPIAIANNIVNIQAQYGFAPQNPTPGNPAPAVNTWSDATAAPLTTADIMRIKAIRIAIVARSSLKEKPSIKGGACDATAVMPISWLGGPVIDLTANPDWQCYRYHVYQTIIPLRNVIWANL
ncbi:MAG: PilW family protein [Sideroxydans sp.]|nr:PilW family protein [Sideroxydans sp.]